MGEYQHVSSGSETAVRSLQKSVPSVVLGAQRRTLKPLAPRQFLESHCSGWLMERHWPNSLLEASGALLSPILSSCPAGRALLPGLQTVVHFQVSPKKTCGDRCHENRSSGPSQLRLEGVVEFWKRPTKAVAPLGPKLPQPSSACYPLLISYLYNMIPSDF